VEFFRARYLPFRFILLIHSNSTDPLLESSHASEFLDEEIETNEDRTTPRKIEDVGTNGSFWTFVLTTKTYLGSGLLSLPYAFAQGSAQRFVSRFSDKPRRRLASSRTDSINWMPLLCLGETFDSMQSRNQQAEANYKFWRNRRVLLWNSRFVQAGWS
jgi:hypothetical protein